MSCPTVILPEQTEAEKLYEETRERHQRESRPHAGIRVPLRPGNGPATRLPRAADRRQIGQNLPLLLSSHFCIVQRNLLARLPDGVMQLQRQRSSIAWSKKDTNVERGDGGSEIALTEASSSVASYGVTFQQFLQQGCNRDTMHLTGHRELTC